MAAIYGPQAPKKKAPVARGPIQPAFPVEAYARPGGPWNSLLEGSIPKPGGSPEDILPLVERVPPRTFQNTGVAENVFSPENIELAGGVNPQLKPQYVQTPIIGNRIGESSEADIKAAQEFVESNKKDYYMSPTEKRNLDLITENSPAMKRVRADIDARKDLGDQYQSMLGGRKQGVDLSPLMALSDAWTGSRFAQSYKPPANPMDKFKDILAYKDKISDDEQKFADAITRGTQYLKAGTTSYVDKKVLDEIMKRKIENPDPNAWRGRDRDPSLKAAGFLSNFKNIDYVKEADKALIGANEVLGNIKNPSWLTDSTVRSSILKTMQVFPVSDRDVQSVTGGESIKESINRFLNRMSKGEKFLPSDRKVIEEYATLKKAAAEKQVRGAASEYAKSHGPMYGFDLPQALSLLEASIPKSGYAQKPQMSEADRAARRAAMLKEIKEALKK